MTDTMFNVTEQLQDRELTINILNHELQSEQARQAALRAKVEVLSAELVEAQNKLAEIRNKNLAADVNAQPNFFGLMQAGIEKEIQRCTQDYLASSTFRDMVISQVEESIADLNIRSMIDESIGESGLNDIVQENIVTTVKEADFETLIEDALSRNGLVEAAVEAAIEDTLNNVRIDFSPSRR